MMTKSGRGTVATGRLERGTLKKGTPCEVIGGTTKPFKTTVTGIETYHKTVDEAHAGDQIGLLIRGVKRDEIKRGQVSQFKRIFHLYLKLKYSTLSKS